MQLFGFLRCAVLVASVWILILTSALYSQSQTNPHVQTLPKAEITVSLMPSKCKLGGPVNVRFKIVNTGMVPFYIPPIIEKFGRSGFDVEVIPPPSSKGIMKVVTAGDPGAGPEFNIQEEAARWIVLRPGDFYGSTQPVDKVLLPSAGKYKVVVRHTPPRLSEVDKARLKETLKFPVLLDTIDSEPVVLEIVK